MGGMCARHEIRIGLISCFCKNDKKHSSSCRADHQLIHQRLAVVGQHADFGNSEQVRVATPPSFCICKNWGAEVEDLKTVQHNNKSSATADGRRPQSDAILPLHWSRKFPFLCKKKGKGELRRNLQW